MTGLAILVESRTLALATAMIVWSASASTAQGQAIPAPQSAPVVPGTQIDPVARAMAAEALAQADSLSINKTTIVGTDIAGTPPVANAAGTIGNSPIQVNGTNPDNTGYLAFRYGADAAGISNYWVKTRGTSMNMYTAVKIGDRIVSDFWQAGTGGQTGHVGGSMVSVDNTAFTAGEVAGRWALFTGTGIHSSQVSKQYPNRFGSINAIVANSYQQVLFPGGVSAAVPPHGANFGGWVVIGAGAPSPGFGALKFLSAGAVLLAAPEAGAFEVDAAAKPYFTTGDGVRRALVLAETASPTIRVLAGAGAGATATIDANGTSGLVSLVAGAQPGSGDLFTITYAHPYASASYPVVSAANAAAIALVKNAYLTATARGFTLSLPSGLGGGTAYAITFNAPGK